MSFYYEAHVTVEPVFDDALEEFKRIAAAYQFRVADLLMQKRAENTRVEVRHVFCTGRATDYVQPDGVHDPPAQAAGVLRCGGTRSRTHTLLDSRHEDTLRLLGD